MTPAELQEKLPDDILLIEDDGEVVGFMPEPGSGRTLEEAQALFEAALTDDSVSED